MAGYPAISLERSLSRAHFCHHSHLLGRTAKYCSGLLGPARAIAALTHTCTGVTRSHPFPPPHPPWSRLAAGRGLSSSGETMDSPSLGLKLGLLMPCFVLGSGLAGAPRGPHTIAASMLTDFSSHLASQKLPHWATRAASTATVGALHTTST